MVHCGHQSAVGSWDHLKGSVTGLSFITILFSLRHFSAQFGKTGNVMPLSLFRSRIIILHNAGLLCKVHCCVKNSTNKVERPQISLKTFQQSLSHCLTNLWLEFAQLYECGRQYLLSCWDSEYPLSIQALVVGGRRINSFTWRIL